MSLRSIPLFDNAGRATGFMLAQIRKRSPAQPARTEPWMDRDGAPNATFRGWWRVAFPARRELPKHVANPDGTGTEEFWSVFG